MEDGILEFLAAVVEILIEVILPLIAEVTLASVERSRSKAEEESEPGGPLLAGTLYLLIGIGFGVLTVLLFPHPFFHPSRFHGSSLVVSPVLTGLLMARIGLARRRKGQASVRLESFAYGFIFALGVAGIRFFFVL
jgi:hypothetical protein